MKATVGERTRMNNFDKSSSGTDIEFSVGRDTFLSGEDWKENFNTLIESSYYKNALHQYIDCGNEEKISIGDLRAIDEKNTLKRDLLAYALTVDWNYYSKTEIRAMNKDRLIELIESDEEISYMDLGEVESWASDNNFGLELDNYTIIETKGYSQGDFAEVAVHDKFIEEDWLRKHIDHLFWDAPVYYLLRVNGEDYYIDEYIKDNYEYTAKEVYEICEKLFVDHKDKKYILEFIADNSPEYAEYD